MESKIVDRAAPRPDVDTPYPTDIPHMSVHAFTLAFTGKDASLEQPFLEWYKRSSIPPIRLVLISGTILIGLFGILDAYLLSTHKYTLWLIRFAILCPGALLVLLASHLRNAWRYIHWLMMGMVVVTGSGFIVMTALTPPPTSFLYYAGLILVFMYGYSLARQRFILASVAGWIVVLLYQLTTPLFTRIPVDVLVSNTFFLVAANIIGMMSSYVSEKNGRRDFYLTHHLARERDRVRNTNAELEARVRERTADLQHINENLAQEIADRKRSEEERLNLERRLLQSQKMESLGVMAGGIAHDFNNILVAVMGNAEVGLRKGGEENPLAKYFDRILASAERARLLVQQMLTFSRRQVTERQASPMQQIAQEAIGIVQSLIPAHIRIETEFHPAPLPIYVDRVQIHQVIVNLCLNAAQAMEPNGGVIRVKEDVGTVKHGETDLASGKYVVLRVEDSGHGIPPEILPRIFEPFFTTKTPGKGTGLGLAVVHGIVTSHGGMIRVDSKPEEGTTVSVFLPLAEDDQVSEPTTPDEAQPALSTPKKILLVDDQQEALQVTHDLLIDHGYEVRMHSDPHEALREFRASPHEFDAVITDLTMPGMSGLEIAKHVTGISPHCPVVLITGYQLHDDREMLEQSGVREILQKPFRSAHLAETVKRALR